MIESDTFDEDSWWVQEADNNVKDEVESDKDFGDFQDGESKEEAKEPVDVEESMRVGLEVGQKKQIEKLPAVSSY